MRFTVYAPIARRRRNQSNKNENVLAMSNPPLSFTSILLMGAVAGFTIYLGLPFALVKSKTIRTFASSFSVGILFFILIDILGKTFDTVKEKIVEAAGHGSEWGSAASYAGLLVLGIAGAYLGLVFFEQRWIKKSGDSGLVRDPRTLALIIAVGIGLHNFSEGLAIGQELAKGAMALGYLLVIGFALHNATEGFGIAAPLTGEKPGIGFLFLLGMVGGGPTVIGTVIGESFQYPILETFFLALASGAIFYVIGELSHIGRQKGSHITVAFGIIVGLLLAFGSDVLVDSAHALISH